MKRILGTVLAVALLLGLGALAVLALPNGSATLAPVSAAAPEFEPDAPAAVQNYFNVAIPLDSSSQISPFDSNGLIAHMGAGVVQVLSWDEVGQGYLVATYDPVWGIGGDYFPLAIGESYWLLLESTAPKTMLSLVGGVPAEESVTFTMARGTPCKYNQFSVPLDQGALAGPSADALLASLGATQLLFWDKDNQGFLVRTYDPIWGVGGDDFAVKIGYPYTACLLPTAPAVWPVYP